MVLSMYYECIFSFISNEIHICSSLDHYCDSTQTQQTDTANADDADDDDNFLDLPNLSTPYDSDDDSDYDSDDDSTTAFLFQQGLRRSNPMVEVEDDDDDVKINEVLVQQDMKEDSETSDTHREKDKWATYMKEKQDLIASNTKVEVKASNFPPKIVWQVVDDVKEKDVPPQREVHKKRGILDFDFSERNRTVPATDKRKRNARINFFHLFKHLWPGDAKEQVERMNDVIKLDNEKKRAFKSSVPIKKTIKE